MKRNVATAVAYAPPGWSAGRYDATCRALPNPRPPTVRSSRRLARETRKEAEAVLDAFLQSDLPERFRKIKIIGREVPVMAPETDGKLLQGSIDLLYRDGKEVVVADFKSDRETKGLAEKYQAQLGAYARSVQAALQLKTPPRTEIWALRTGEILPV